MSTDEDRNLNECLILLDKLFNIALRIPDEQKNALIDCIDIYVGAKYEMASMLIDANINDMGNDIFFTQITYAQKNVFSVIVPSYVVPIQILIV